MSTTYAMTTANGRATDSAIRALEDHLGVDLPSDYKRFLKQCNGGKPENDEVKIDGWGITGIQRFNGLALGDCYDIEKITQLLLCGDRIAYLPIASEPGGSNFFLCVSGADYGSVYFKDHHDSNNKMFLLAESFDRFFDSLLPEGTFD